MGAASTSSRPNVGSGSGTLLPSSEPIRTEDGAVIISKRAGVCVGGWGGEDGAVIICKRAGVSVWGGGGGGWC